MYFLVNIPGLRLAYFLCNAYQHLGPSLYDVTAALHHKLYDPRIEKC